MGEYFVLGEGGRDKGFLEALCNARKIQGLVFDEAKGCDKFGAKLNAMSAQSSFRTCKAILLMGDNDASAGKSYAKIKEQLNNIDFPSPTRPLEMTRKKNYPAIAVLMIPYPAINGSDDGCLETMLIPAMESANRSQSDCVDTLIQCAGVAGWKNKGARDKMKVRCLISSVWEDDPMHGLQYCFSQRKNLIPTDHAIFNGVAEILANFQAWAESGIVKWDDWRRANK
jgi:hypothetical protein